MKPWEQFLFNLANLLRVKTLITLVIVFIFCFMVFRDMEISSDFFTIFAVVVTYWLCKKTKRREDEE